MQNLHRAIFGVAAETNHRGDVEVDVREDRLAGPVAEGDVLQPDPPAQGRRGGFRLPRLGGEILLAEPGRPYAKEFLERFRAETVGDRIYRLR